MLYFIIMQPWVSRNVWSCLCQVLISNRYFKVQVLNCPLPSWKCSDVIAHRIYRLRVFPFHELISTHKKAMFSFSNLCSIHKFYNHYFKSIFLASHDHLGYVVYVSGSSVTSCFWMLSGYNGFSKQIMIPFVFDIGFWKHETLCFTHEPFWSVKLIRSQN